MVKDISKYLYSRDGEKLSPSYMEDGPAVTKHIEDCMLLGLGISGAVNKLSALLAGAKFFNPGCSAINIIEAQRLKKTAEKTACFTTKRSCSPSQQPSKKRKTFNVEEVKELDEYFRLRDCREKPTTKEIETFFENCQACRNRNLTSIKNKVYNMLKKILVRVLILFCIHSVELTIIQPGQLCR